MLQEILYWLNHGTKSAQENGNSELVVGSQELLNLSDGECKFITVDRSLVLEGAIMPLARITSLLTDLCLAQ